MTIRYLKKSPKTSSTDDTKTTEIVKGLLKDIENSWSLDSIEKGKLGVCAMKCGSEFDPFGAQFE